MVHYFENFEESTQINFNVEFYGETHSITLNPRSVKCLLTEDSSKINNSTSKLVPPYKFNKVTPKTETITHTVNPIQAKVVH